MRSPLEGTPMAIQFDEAGRLAEELVHTWYGLEFITDLNQQYKDIDFVDDIGTTYSVKDQLWSSADYGSITAEYELGTTKNSTDRRAGNLITNNTDVYLWLVTFNRERGFLAMDSEKFKDFVLTNKSEWRVRSLTRATVAHNTRLGRYYNLAWSYAIPVNLLINQKWSMFDKIPLPVMQKHYFNKNKGN